jgi:uncharacterized membrane protein
MTPNPKPVQPPPWREAVAVLAALCFFLSAVEFLIPKFLPFFRIGLANAPVLLALPLPPAAFFSLLLLKTLGGALFSGSLFSWAALLSFGGSFAGGLGMYLLYRAFCGGKKWRKLCSANLLHCKKLAIFSRARLKPPFGFLDMPLSLVGISCAGAFFSNIAQLLLARYIALGRGAYLVAVPVLALGVVTGTALGFFTREFAGASVWYKRLLTDVGKKKYAEQKSRTAPVQAGYEEKGSRRPRISIINLIFVSFGIIFFNLLSPFGRELLRVGPLLVTEGALLTGFTRAIVLEGMFVVSNIALSFLPRGKKLPGFFGELLYDAMRIFSALNRPGGKTFSLRGVNLRHVNLRTLPQALDKILLEL